MDQSAQQQTSLRWHGDWRTSVFTALLLPLLIGLGLWQLQRAVEKEQIARVWDERQQQAPRPLPLEFTGSAELAYLRVELLGQFLPHRQFLLDNRMRQGRYGMEVLTPLRLQESERVVLVNRGWVAADPARRLVPQVATPPGLQRLHGTVYVSPGMPYTLGAEIDSGPWPRQLLTLDMTAITAMLGEPIYPYSVRLDADSPTALGIDWPLLNISPEKHQAYALQWFAMALALACLYLVRSSNILAWLGLRRGGGHD
ncbi:MAG: SURF1 family protein [Gammaproteobacteria bacterium]|nr:SURF1 family protein [Gammaproteobacteria bacterium]